MARGHQTRRSSRGRRGTKSSRRRVWGARRLLIAASIVLVGAALAYALAGAQRWAGISDRFVVAGVEVKGNSVLTREEVVEFSGVEIGERLPALDIGEIESALARSPRIESAQVYGLLPDRVLIRIEERPPFALLDGPAGAFEVAADGTVLPPAARTALLDLPVITGSDCDEGVANVANDAHVADALELLGRARDVSRELLDEISEVKIAPEFGLVTYTVADGAEIRLGFGALDENGLRRLWTVLRDLRERGLEAEQIDMTFAHQIVVKLRTRPGNGRV